jgi:hypothetical protein
MTADSLQWIGWVATAMTVASYFFRNPVTLRTAWRGPGRGVPAAAEDGGV